MTAASSKVKCLLVDDVRENLNALAAILRQDDVELLMAQSGEEALELLLTHEVALVLLDVQMPGMDGFELAEAMRGTARTRNIPLIFVTAGSRDAQRLFAGYELGAVDFLYKPVEPHLLRNKAEVFFALHRQSRELARQLAESNETLRFNEMFTAVLGHDLRNPLTAMVLSAERLQRRSADPEVHESARLMLACAQRMSRMIEDLLDVARARLGGGIELTRETVDLVEPLQKVIDEHRSATARTIRFTAQGDARLECDASRLAQAASNLIGNALRHGGPEGAIEVLLDGTRPAELSFSVGNEGTIPPELLPQLFDPFRSGSRSGARSEGLGLGLFIVDQLVRAHGGTVTVESAGRTVFRVQLPRRAVARAAPAFEAPPPAVPAPARRSGTLH